ncbi:right-handed parallel beta-helix repeat-containing protein [Methanomassiliicoccus luminyensis]|uniref:right-handed parallel beta-helix repeat-containing protein n=1 Tax=Methanomassiliicoccus luminyensis TaxID=1080712 RepID=UPI00138B121E|nr:right-handed parallel beta-helix repeat-containing protein [Methanomassiliicoccus luminyensis]
MRDLTRKALLSIVSFLLIASLFAPLGAIGNVQGDPLSLETHDVIRVNNETELSTLISNEGWDGTGSADDPYVIENLSINALGYGAGIFIGNTTSHLVIRNCTIYDAEWLLSEYQYGGNILLYNVTNAVIENNICYDVNGGDSDGIDLFYSHDNIVRNNNCSDNRFYGIYLNTSNDNVIEDNTCNLNDYGIYLEGSYDNIVNNNICNSNNDYGICLFISNDNVVGNNTCNSNYCGIGLSASAGITMENNIIADAERYGIYVAYTTDSTIYGNAVINCAEYGIRLSSCYDNLLYRNVFVNNNGATSEYNNTHVQAYDDGDNDWNSSSYGNVWSDWISPDVNRDGIVDSSYAIDGGLKVDSYPLVTVPHVTITSPVNGTVTKSSTVLVSGTADPDCPLVINGIMVHVNENGTFSVVIALLEGNNTIEATSGFPVLTAEDSVTVTYIDQTPGLLDDIDEIQDRLDEASDRIDDLTAQLNVHDVKAADDSSLALMVGAVGVVFGIVAVGLFFFMYVRKPRTP